MSLAFTDPKLYVKGVGAAYLRDGAGNVVYYSNKFQNGQITPSADQGEIAAGIGNPIAAMIPTNGRLAVNFTAADFDLFTKASAVGGTLEYGAPVPVCQTVVASGTTLSIDVTGGTPVKNIGMSSIICYVQEVGAASPIGSGGTAYPLSAAGVVSGFTAVSGHTYKVTYFVSRANARLATLSGNMDGKVLHFTAEFAVYTNVNTANMTGSRWGTLYAIVPTLKLTADGAGIDGDQTSNTTTGIIGQAMMYDETSVQADCDSCGSSIAPLGYYLLVPCDTTADIGGLVLVGGVLTVPTSSTHTVNEFRLLVGGNNLALPDPALMTYSLSGAPSGTSVSGNVITAGSTAGDGEITGTYTDGDVTYTCVANLSVVEPSP